MTPRPCIVIAFAAGCFGGGAAPQPPSDLTILFNAPPPQGNVCTESVYVGDVAFGMVHGFAITVPYLPSGPNAGNCCPGGGSCPQPDEQLLAVYSFDKGGSDPAGMKVAAIPGQFPGDTFPRLSVINGDSPVWAWPSTNSQVALSTGQNLMMTTIGGSFTPASMLADASNLYVAAWSGSQRADVDSPDYPCCGMFGGQANNFAFAKVNASVTAMPITPAFQCGTAPRCLVQNTQTLFYFEQDPMNQTPPSVSAYPKSGTTANDRKPLFMLDTSKVPVGLAANDAHFVWAESTDYSVGGAVPGCEIGVWNLGTDQPMRVFTSDRLSCMGLALDGDMVYTTIVAPDTGDCGSCTEPLLGVGIARFSLSNPTGTFESRALNVSGVAGPRRIHVEGNDIFLMDPAVIFRVNKDTALAGAHDFSP